MPKSPSPAGPLTVTGRRGRVLPVLAVLAAVAVYLNALDNPFVYDDFRTVRDNPTITDPGNLAAIVGGDATRPLVNLTFALDRAAWGPGPFGFHLTNVLLHAVNVWLLYTLALALAGDRRRGTLGPEVAAFVTAAAFAVHPMMTQAVGFISGRAEPLCAVFFLAALLAARRWLVERRPAWLLAAIGLWVPALLSKEIAVTWPVVVLLYDLLVLEDTPARRRARVLRVYVPAAVVLVGFAWLRLHVLSGEYADHQGVFWRHVLVELEALRQYVSLLVVPAGQSIFHGLTAIDQPFSAAGLRMLAWAAALVALTVIVRRRAPLASFGLGWFLVGLVPSAVLVIFNLGEPMAEHRVYLASCGFFVAVGAVAARALDLAAQRGATARLAMRAALVGWLILLAGLTVSRNAVWGDPVALWLEAVGRSPDIWVPHVGLGQSLHAAGQREEAVVAYRRAIDLRASQPEPYVLLGSCLIELGRPDEAALVFEDLRRVAPRSADPFNGLGAVALFGGRHAEAKAYFEKALELEPGNRSALAWLQRLAALDAGVPATGVMGPAATPR